VLELVIGMRGGETMDIDAIFIGPVVADEPYAAAPRPDRKDPGTTDQGVRED
jgi:hypothetical protein